MRNLILLASFAAGGALHASSDFAHCSLASEQLKRLNDYMVTELRVRAAESLIADLDLLRPMMTRNTTDLPDKLLKVCYSIKKKAFEAIMLKGAADLYGSYDFLMAAGQYFFYEKEWEASFKTFDSAAKLQPRLFLPNHFAFQAWILYQLTLPKAVSPEVYNRTARRFVTAMMSAKDVTEKQRRIIARYLGTLEEKSARAYTAREIYESAVRLNPANLKSRLAWGEFEERAGKFATAQTIYGDGLRIGKLTADQKHDLYLRIFALYKFTGNRGQYTNYLQQALTDFPNDPEFAKLPRFKAKPRK